MKEAQAMSRAEAHAFGATRSTAGMWEHSLSENRFWHPLGILKHIPSWVGYGQGGGGRELNATVVGKACTPMLQGGPWQPIRGPHSALQERQGTS